MGGFHCPVGAVSYQSYGCIGCKMCFAGTKKEIEDATEIIRNYIRSTAEMRVNAELKKIAVCGKGGSGKSTVSAMLAFALRDLGFQPIVIDTDDSNAGLHRKLGITDAPMPLIACTARFSIGQEAADNEWLQRDLLSSSEIPDCFIREKNGIRFMMSGKIENPLQGCACTISDITKELVTSLDLGEKEVLIMDQDAGIESFGRGAEQGMDTILIIVEPSFESVDLAGTIQYMAGGIGIRRIRAIINKTFDEEQEETVQEMLSDRGIRFLGSLPADRSMMKLNLNGLPVSESDLQKQFTELVKLMLDEAEVIYNQEERKNV